MNSSGASLSGWLVVQDPCMHSSLTLRAAEFCEKVLWALVESGAQVAEGVQYSDFLSAGARNGTVEHGRGALVLAGPTAALKSWFQASSPTGF